MLDVLLPGFDGLEVCRRIQGQHPVPNPFAVDRPVVRRPAQRSVEWLAPVLLVDAVFAQLTTATALTLLVVWAAARKAEDTAADRRWLRVSFGRAAC